MIENNLCELIVLKIFKVLNVGFFHRFSREINRSTMATLTF